MAQNLVRKEQIETLELNDLNNVNATNVNNHVLFYRGSGSPIGWDDIDLGTLAETELNLEDLANVSISGPNEGDILTYNGSSWVDLQNNGNYNYIINGNFDFWQRNSTFNGISTDTYTADRWMSQFDGAGATYNVSKQTFTQGQTDVPGEPKHYLRMNQSVAGGGATFNYLVQRIEGVRTLAGETVTVSMYVKADSARNFNIVLSQDEDSTDATVESNAVSGVLGATTSWQKFTFTTTLGSIAAFTINETSNSNSLNLAISFPLNVTQTWDIAQVTVERGAVATQYNKRLFTEELALCQRYFEKSYNLDTSPGTSTQTGATFYEPETTPQDPWNTSLIAEVKHFIPFIVTKRVSPTVTHYCVIGGATGYCLNNGISQCQPVLVGQTTLHGTTVGHAFPLSGTYPVVAGDELYYHWTADAEL